MQRLWESGREIESVNGMLRVEIGPAAHPVVGSVTESADVTTFAIADFCGRTEVLACHERVEKIER